MRKILGLALIVLTVTWMAGCASTTDNTNTNVRTTNSSTAINKMTPYEASPTPEFSNVPDTYRNNNAVGHGNRNSNKNPTADKPQSKRGDSTGMRGATPTPTHTPR